MPALSGGMILYRSLSAKSVACSRLNVIGVSAFFFFPVFVAALTSADEFHSVTKTRWPSAASHFASSPSCVVFPEPSIPSTTKSLPGYSCGFIRLFNIRISADFDAKRLADQLLEGRGLTARRPQFELGVARRAYLQQRIVLAVVQFETGNRLRMAAIEAFREPHDRRQRSYDPPPLAAQSVEHRMTAFRCRAAVIARDQRDHLDLVGLEPAEIAILDEVIRVLVM